MGGRKSVDGGSVGCWESGRLLRNKVPDGRYLLRKSRGMPSTRVAASYYSACHPRPAAEKYVDRLCGPQRLQMLAGAVAGAAPHCKAFAGFSLHSE